MRAGSVTLEFGLGLDLDCGRTTDNPYGTGADVEAVPDATQLVVTSRDPRAGVAWIDHLGPEDFARCASVAESDYLREIAGLDRPLVSGRGICVRTGEGNLAIISPDSPAVVGGPGFDLHYVIRYGQP
ncbi:hypothetical protein GCM10027436_10850 [Actinophytocola sediminis]